MELDLIFNYIKQIFINKFKYKKLKENNNI